MNALPTDAVYITSLREILWGVILVAGTLIIHAIGMILTQAFCDRFGKNVRQRYGALSPFLSGLSTVVLASWMIVLVHCVEVIMWAAFFQWKDCFPNFSTAAYFSFTEYTTLGSSYNLPQKWRLLEGMIATAGLLAFAWSTGVLMTLATVFQDQQLARLHKRAESGHRQGPG